MSYRVCLTALLLLVPFQLPVVYAETEVTIATFNCEWLIKDKIEEKYELDSLTPAARQQKFDAAVTAVAKVIKSIGADVIGLTEVGPESDVEALRLAVQAEGLNYSHKAVCTSKDTATKQHVAVLSKYPLAELVDVIPGREFYDEELDDPEEEADTGISKGLHVRFEVYGQPIHLYVCHFISERQGHESDAKRVAQASVVRRHYLDFMWNGEHVIVTGDLNAARGSPTLRRIRGRDDLFGDLIQTGHSKYFAADQLDQRWTYQFKGKRQQIDHALPSWSLKEATKSISARTLEITETLPGGKAASDHRPFLVTFTFP